MLQQASRIPKMIWISTLLGVLIAGLYILSVRSVSASAQSDSAANDAGSITVRIARAQKDPNNPNQYC